MAEDTIHFLSKGGPLSFQPADTTALPIDFGSGESRGMHPSEQDALNVAVQKAADEEMCMTVEDFLARRYRTLFLDARTAMDAARNVAERLALAHGKKEHWIEDQIQSFQQLAENYLPQNNP